MAVRARFGWDPGASPSDLAANGGTPGGRTAPATPGAA
jgi:hypothetical protein